MSADILASTVAFIDVGVYQTLPCGCFLTAHEIDPRGPRSCFVSNAKGACDKPHTVDDFMPLRWSPSEWFCLCGARNRLRDTTCRNCGDPKPEAHE